MDIGIWAKVGGIGRGFRLYRLRGIDLVSRFG